MRSESGIAMLTISAEIMGRIESVHPTLLWDQNDVILIDSAYPGQLPLIMQELLKEQIRLKDISHIIITHQDLDHIGCIPALLKELDNQVEIIASPLEKPYIQGDRMLLKLTPSAVEAAVRSLPEHLPSEWKASFRTTLLNPPRFSVNKTISHLEELPFCGGIIVIDTPGHTPGHISLFHKRTQTLIAADALRVENNQLLFPDPQLCSDFEQAKASVKQFLDFDITEIICHHGGSYSNNVRGRINELCSSN
ncbi:MBL fold metallo-hydrolase [Paenibacillus sp. GSMTC-2017]|uniref:MBL fold metallo-hydrolase n=1 Tax=Paenibacillus sp. GSMTC-2017 TaxID=2794350 RepID=UPI0018DA05FE|nr:MBL fold metallo-hydrolase [Paenibacillus sp. GSMTC-2017]MBH5316452.1 MBL fold metallo-hydrolase [Paenibacillus sp. GSMTC-2017]